MKLLAILGMALGLAGCALAVPAAVGGAAGYIVSNEQAKNQPHYPPRPLQ
jgi:hypothetical protein